MESQKVSSVERVAPVKTGVVRRRSLLGLLALLGIAGIVPGCTPPGIRDPSGLLPDALDGLALKGVRLEEAASSMINALHGEQVDGSRNAVGEYAGPEGSATLYVSAYDDSATAGRQFELMRSGIRRSRSPFTHTRPARFEGQDVMTTMGLGQVHYFYADANRVVWLSADAGIADRTIRSLLRNAAPGTDPTTRSPR